MSTPSSSQAPPIRSFQFNASSVANVRSSVNLFRGDVNFTQALFTMPGRSPKQGLDVNLSLMCQSNVFCQATTWNRDAPTGVAGLGWDLPVTSIEVDYGNSPSPATRSYSYVANGSGSPLVREPGTPYLFSLPLEDTGQLVAGQKAPSSVVQAFGQHGLVLSASAAVLSAGEGAWILQDDDNRQLFNLNQTAGALTASDGGESYQLQSYKFWKILYYPCYERWAVTDESGRVMSFGGRTSPAGVSPATSTGNSIEWGVCWTSPSGSPLWLGPSALTTGQAQYARVWNLTTISDLWGDSVNYAYNAVEQLVAPPGSSDGLPYTKACYLSSVTDVFGRRAIFQYADKLWDNSTPESPREYADPHKAAPDDTPNAWQDCYETRYLQGITVQNTVGATLFSIAFQYAPRPSVQGINGQVANVTAYTGSLAGDTFKRYLTGVVFSNAEGDSPPAMSFDYYLEATENGAAVAGYSPGALRSVTYPAGATASWGYTQQFLTQCQRTQTVAPPAGISSSSSPRLWFGPDYAVVLWCDSNAQNLSLQIFTWFGRWIEWQPEATDPLIFSNSSGFTPATLNVIATEGFLAVSFEAANLQVYVYGKDLSRPGQWLPATIGKVTTAKNTPSLSYSTAGGKGSVKVQGGGSFLLVPQMNAASSPGSYSYDRLTWRWTTRSWTLETSGQAGLPKLENYTWMTASAEYYAGLDPDGNAFIYYLDSTLQWKEGGSTTIPGFSESVLDNVLLVPSASFVVASQLKPQGDDDQCSYNLIPLQWDENYSFLPPIVSLFNDSQDPSYPTGWIPTVVSNSIIACAGNVLRFNGAQWLSNSNLETKDQTGGQQRYAYGMDYTVQVFAPDNGEPQAKLVAYNPNSDSLAWNAPAVKPAQLLSNPPHYSATANYPSEGSGDYMAIGQYLYFRGTACDWSDIVAAPPLADLQAEVNTVLKASPSSRYILNAQSVINEGPAFLTYYVYDTQQSSERLTAIALLQNGQVLASSTNPYILNNEQISIIPGPGTDPGGPAVFAGFPGTAGQFTKASSFNLHQYAGNQVNGAIMHYAVTSFVANNGFDGDVTTAIIPNLSSATCDSSGTVFKYYQSTVCPATAPANPVTQPPPNPAYGSVVACYMNGLEIMTGANYYDMLDGLLNSVTVQDSAGNVLSKTSLDWTVWSQRAPDPADATPPVANLYGGFVVRSGVTRTKDGVTGSVAMSYLGKDPSGVAFSAPWSAQAVGSQITALGSSGKPETNTKETLFGCQLDEVQRALNILTTKAQSLAAWALQGGASVPIRASATTRRLWPCARGTAVSVPAEEASFAWTGTGSTVFPYSTYQPGQSPAGWQCQGRVLSRIPLGLPNEGADPGGVITSVIYQGSETFPVAEMANASLSLRQWAYLGFESYEDTAGWTLQGTQVNQADAYTGSQSLELPGNSGATLSTQVAPASGGQSYVLGYAIKTPANFSPTTGTGWTISVTPQGQAPAIPTVAFADTNGAWAYRTIGIVIPSGTGPFIVSISATNGTSQTVLLDSVSLAPLVSTLTAQTFNPNTGLSTSLLSGNDSQSLTAYDRFASAVASLGPDSQVLQLTQDFSSREGNAASEFATASPNAHLTLRPAQGGIMDLFRSGDEWQARWTASSLATNWQVTDGALVHVGVKPDSLSWKGWGNSTPHSAALFFEVYAPKTLTGAVAINFGDFSLGWNATAVAWQFIGPQGFTSPTPLARPPGMAQQWLLVFGQGVLLFFGGGQLIFSVPWAAGVPASTSINTGPNVLQFRNLAMMGGPRLSLDYADAAGTTRQSQQLIGNDAIIGQTIQDPLGRTLAITKTAPANFGADAALPLLSYHPSFVDVTAFLAATVDSWEMTGDIADYYQGQTENDLPRSNDEGYPYSGSRYESSPRKRRLESGQPGQPYAISDIRETTTAQRQTQQYAYGSADNNGYFTQSGISPVKSVTTQVTTVTRQKVATQTADSAGGITSQTRILASYAGPNGTAAGMNQTVQLPNSFTTAPQSDPDAYTASSEANSLGQAVKASGPDDGTTAYIYDAAERPRFCQPALDSGEEWFFYCKYDPLGRLIEQGTIRQAWNALQLAAEANQPDYPTAGSAVPFLVTRATTFDGDGNDPATLGRPILVVTTTAAPSVVPSSAPCVTTESYTYDKQGRVVSVNMSLSTHEAPSGVIGYHYNNLDQVIQIDYPQGSPLAQALYTYDDAGRILSIGSAAATPDDIAWYAYNVAGNVEVALLNQKKLTVTRQYNSPGWLQNQSATPAGATSPAWSLNHEYYPDATVQQRTETVTLPNGTSNTVVNYAYNAQRRLLSATVAEGPGSDAITSYDANGNIWAATTDGKPASFECAPGSDLLSSVVLGDDQPMTPSYNARGQLTACGPLSASYDPCLSMPAGFATSGSKMQLGYGAQNQRITKQVSGSAVLAQFYFCGASSRPLALQCNGVWTALVYGPGGLVACVQDQLYFALTDAQNSVRAIVDAGNHLAARYQYRVFGAPLAASGPELNLIPYRFMGQEWDEETGLYNFVARTYNPVLCRFHEPDPSGQYAGPYVFVGNDPVSMIDPNGEAGMGALLTDTSLEVAVALGGAALTLVSGGASDAVAASLDTGIAVAESAEVADDVAGAADVADIGSSTLADADGASSLDAGNGSGAEAEIDTGVSTGSEGQTSMPSLGSSTQAEDSPGSSARYRRGPQWRDAHQARSRGRTEHWFKFWRDKEELRQYPGNKDKNCGATVQKRVEGSKWYKPKYNPKVFNFVDFHGNPWGWLDTQAHEEFHASVGKNFPRWTKATKSRIIGKPLTYIEELGAYTTGHTAALRFHALPFVGIEALYSTLDI